MPIRELPIPEKRKSALIGKQGRVKRSIEKATGTVVEVDDSVVIEGPVEGLLKAENVVSAISRGFEPKVAKRLLDEQCQLEIISLEKETENTRRRLFARVIGRNGESKRIIEKETGASISVYGKTVSIIGFPEELDAAQRAVEALLKGKKHGYAYRQMK